MAARRGLRGLAPLVQRGCASLGGGGLAPRRSPGCPDPGPAGGLAQAAACGPFHGDSGGPLWGPWGGAAGRRAYASGKEGQTALIKELRTRTGAPIKDVKAALETSGWDLEEAMTELRKRGIAAASKKASRVAAEGLLGVALAPAGTAWTQQAAVVEINSETDFVARNDLFQNLVSGVAKAALDSINTQSPTSTGPPFVNEIPVASLEALAVNLNHEKLSGERRIAEAVAEVSGVTGENVKLRRAFSVTVPAPYGFIASYLHSSSGPGLGRMASFIVLKQSVDLAKDSARLQHGNLPEVGGVLAMHAVAARPQFLSRTDVPSAVLAHEREVLQAQAVSSGKPPKVVESMVEGRLKRFYRETVFLEQSLATDDKLTVEDYLSHCAKSLDTSIQILDFLRVEVGEGISKEPSS